MIKVFTKNVFAIFSESQYLIVSYCSTDWVWGHLAFYHEATTASAEFVDTEKNEKEKDYGAREDIFLARQFLSKYRYVRARWI